MPPHAAAHSIHPRVKNPRSSAPQSSKWRGSTKVIIGILGVLGSAIAGWSARPAEPAAPKASKPADTRPITRDELDAKFETVNIKIGAVDDKVTRIDAKLDRVLEGRR